MKKVVYLLLLLINISLASFGQREQDSLALVALYNSTNGPGWINKTNWLSSEPISKWYGVSIVNSRVVSIDLVYNNLSGLLPIQIGNLTELQVLKLSQNSINGVIPPEIGNLKNLTNLTLSYNELSGTIPSVIWNLSKLVTLALGVNKLSGVIPQEIKNLTLLTSLSLNNNQLSGIIPKEISLLTNLSGLGLGVNHLTGIIPPELGNLSNLGNLSLNDNQLSGGIPKEIGNLVNLYVLWLKNNLLSGPIPSEIGKLNKLINLSLSNNQLSGNVPVEIGNLTNIFMEIELDNNQFTGSIPNEINNIPKLNSLTLQNNRFQELPKLTVDIGTLKIEKNQFTFEDIEPNINVAKQSFTYSPQDSIGLKEIITRNSGDSYTFSVTCGGANNKYLWYKGTFPINTAVSPTYTISNLQPSDAGTYTCAVTNTAVTGLVIYSRPVKIEVVDGSIGRQQDSLALVALFNSTGGPNWIKKTNWLSSEPVSNWYGVTVINKRVNILNLVLNNLTGTIPPEIGNLSDLATIEFGMNHLNGALPKEIGKLQNLVKLALDWNQLEGTIPSEINSLSKLSILNLNSNQLSDLPRLTLPMLSSVSISNNKFTFEDIEPNITIPGIWYSPQDSIGLKKNISELSGESYTFSISCGGANNLYQWKKNNAIIPGATNSTYTIQNLQSYDAGSYTCSVTNGVVPGLIINSRPIILSIGDSNGREQDSLALVALYNSTGGPNWTNKTNWLSSEPISKWYGITMSNNRVSEIYLGLNHLTGTIPQEVGNLTMLSSLILELNQVSGTIPNVIWQLTNLIHIGLNSNQLSGTIPKEIGNLSKLIYLRLYGNIFSGTIPKEIGNLKNLENLCLSNNHFSGIIPVEIWSLTKLKHLWFDNNEFNGSIPAAVNNLTKLISLRLNNNKFNELPSLNLNVLDFLTTENNRFTFGDIEPNINIAKQSFTYSPQDSIGVKKDTIVNVNSSYTFSVQSSGANSKYQWYKDSIIIPAETNSSFTISGFRISDAGSYRCVITNTVVPGLTIFSRPVLIEVVNMSLLRQQDSLALVALFNSTGGPNWINKTNWLESVPISKWFGISLVNGRVSAIDLHENNLVGTIPLEIGSLTELKSIILYKNELTGIVPNELVKLNNLATLNVEINKISGPFPVELCKLINIRDMGLAGNQISGTLPKEIGNLINLERLFLDENQLTGIIPAEIGNLTNLKVLYLSWNQLSGSIPKEIGRLSNLLSINVAYNNLTGPIPEEIVNLQNLVQIGLQHNSLTGTIPAGIGKLRNLDDLILESNQLSGPIPSDIGNLTNLTYLSFRQNQFSGSIPLAIGKLIKLRTLNLSYNQLSGTLPKNIGDLKDLFGLYVSYNKLSGQVPEEINNLNNLRDLFLDHNKLDSLPKLNLNQLFDLLIQNNNFSFDDILPNLNIASHFIAYMEQDSIGIRKSIQANVGENILLKVNCGGDGTKYVWYKNKVLIPSAISASFYIPVLKSTDAGSYTCTMTNPLIPDLILYSRPVRLMIANNGRQQDSLALVSIFNSTGGEKWKNTTNWISSQPLSRWFGVTIANNRVTNLSLPSNNLNGPVPIDIVKLTMLTGLNLNDNKLSGKIPSEIGNLANLTELNLSGNLLNGSPPEEINNLSLLKSIDLSGNNLNALPHFSLPVLDYLTLNDNQLTFEDIEPNINVPKIAFRYSPQDSIGDKQTINSRIGNSYTFIVNCGGTQNLYQWYFNNILIPNATDNEYKIQKLKQSEAGSYTCSVTNTLVTGLTIYSRPYELNVELNGRSQDSLALVTLYNTTGGSSWTNNTNWLSNQPISSWYGVTVGSNGSKSGVNDTTGVLKLELRGNNLTGTLPKEIGDLTSLKTLNLENNHLTGSVPAEINNLYSLQNLELSNNQLDGLPKLTLSNLDTLMINNNQFSFEDIVPNLNVPGNDINYLVQDSIGQILDTICRPYSNFRFIVSDSADQNRYQWYKNTEEINEAINKSFVILNLQQSDSGSYTCKITNNSAPGLILYQRPVRIQISFRTGIDDIELNGIKVYPNPSNGIFNIESAEGLPGDSKIVLTDIYGKTVFIKDYPDLRRQEVNLAHFSKGMYFLWIQNNKRTFYQKIIVR